MSWLLDTDTVSFALRGAGRVGEELRARSPAKVCISAVTAGELWFGVEKRRSARLRRLVGAFLDTIEVVAFDQGAARRFGEIAALLCARGRSIGVADAMIAGHALHLGAVLVTHNVREFERVPRLRCEDWY
jgi:tRNA(fMet)-specific endonuclease VapC